MWRGPCCHDCELLLPFASRPRRQSHCLCACTRACVAERVHMCQYETCVCSTWCCVCRTCLTAYLCRRCVSADTTPLQVYICNENVMSNHDSTRASSPALSPPLRIPAPRHLQYTPASCSVQGHCIRADELLCLHGFSTSRNDFIRTGEADP